MWAGVLHAGPGSAIGGLTALERRGLQRWHRDEITVLLAKSHNLEPLAGVPVRRDPAAGRAVRHRPPPHLAHRAGRSAVRRLQPEQPHGATGFSRQSSSSDSPPPTDCSTEIERMRPLRDAKPFKRTLGHDRSGAQSLAEMRVVRMCLQPRAPPPGPADAASRRLGAGALHRCRVAAAGRARS